MRFERGPFGRIAVFSLESKKDMVLHVMDSLQNHVLPSVLPVYLREHFGQKEFCIDCTGCEQISVCSKNLIWEPAVKRKAVSDFLLALLDAQDHFIDPRHFLFDAEYVFFEPDAKKLLWCCLPVLRDTVEPAAEMCFPTEKLERLLMDSFFADVIDDDERSRIICLMKDGRDNELTGLLSKMASIPKTQVRALPRPAAFLLSAQTILMVITGLLLLYLSMRADQTATVRNLRGWYLLFFSVALLLTVICTGGKGKPVPSDTGEEPESPGLTKKEIYFPEQKVTNGESAWPDRCKEHPPAYLNQIIKTSGENGKKGFRSVVWVDDFLIGRDRILCDLFLDDPSVSDRHARIIRRGVLYLIMDLGSSEGTFIGSQKLYSHEENPLTDGDTLTIGKLKFIFSQN